jgi:hypothetical protein
MTRKLPMVEVEWQDACSENGWARREEYRERTPMSIRSIGFLAHRDKSRLVIVQSHSAGDRLNDSLTIPAPWVTRVRRLQRRRRVP